MGKQSEAGGFLKRCPLVLLRVVIAYALFLTALYIFQRHLLHHPHTYDHAVLIRKTQVEGGALWPTDTAYRGILFANPNQDSRGTILLFHGNAGSALDRGYYVRQLLPLGFRLILLEYPGYGNRAGDLDEDSLVADGASALRLASQQFGPPLYVFGESLGGGVAAASVARASIPVAGIVLLTPWDTLGNVAQSLYWFVPAKYLAKDTYDSVTNLKGFAGPLAIIQAGNDDLVPSVSTLTLFDSFAGKKRLWRIEGATHNTWYQFADREFWTQLGTYLTE
jgi:uncharacterized protein